MHHMHVHSSVLWWNTIKDTRESWLCRDKRPFCPRYRMICFTSSLIRQLYHFATNFNRVLLQPVAIDMENSRFKYRVSYMHLTFMIETFELLMKSCEKFDLLFVHIQCAHAFLFEKVNFKVYQLYLKNYRVRQ